MPNIKKPLSKGKTQRSKVAPSPTLLDPKPYLDKYYPERKFQVRRYFHLWDNYYRVNFHLSFKREFIHKSYFVDISKDVVPAIPISEKEFKETKENELS